MSRLLTNINNDIRMIFILYIGLVYVIVWVAVVFGINCASNAGRKLVILRGSFSQSLLYYSFCMSKVINKYNSVLLVFTVVFQYNSHELYWAFSM